MCQAQQKKKQKKNTVVAKIHWGLLYVRYCKCFIYIMLHILPETLWLRQFYRWEHWNLELLVNLSKLYSK